MYKHTLTNTKVSMVLFFCVVGITHCHSIHSYPTSSSNETISKEATFYEKDQTLLKANKLSLATLNGTNSSKDNVEYVICEISSRNLNWENASCDESPAHDVLCLPIHHPCVNVGDKIHPCNMTCRDEHERMFEQCTTLSEETKQSINLARFLVDGVLKVKLY